MRYSGLQRDVLALYRQSMRMALQKPLEYRSNWIHFVRQEFQKNSQLSPKEVMTMEYLLRQGQKRLETFRNPAIKRVS
jgi:succinate dehydrogenase assembly factor 1